MSQLPIFAADYANRLRARTLARADDPATSKQAARRVVRRLTEQQDEVLCVIQSNGPGTARELSISEGFLPAHEEERFYYTICRRLPELERRRLVRVQQDPSKPCRCKPNATRCRCRDVVRDNSRVWEVVP